MHFIGKFLLYYQSLFLEVHGTTIKVTGSSEWACPTHFSIPLSRIEINLVN